MDFSDILLTFQVIVLHVGTNNITNSPEEIEDGVLELLDLIREKHPDVYIVLPVSMTNILKFYSKCIV